MNAIDRFSLLLLEPGEIYFTDHAATYRLPHKVQEEREGWEKYYLYSEIKGRLKICSKSLVFDPRIKEIPLLRFPLKNCTSIKEGKPPPLVQDRSLYYSEEECTIEVDSEVAVEILEKNVIKPYKFRRKKYTHCFDLNFKKAADVLPQILQLQRASTLPHNDQNVMIEAIVRSLQKRKGFDYTSIKDSREEIAIELEASKITPLITNPGRALVTSHALYYQSFNSLDAENSSLRVPIENIKQITKRRYLLRHVGIEFLYEERTFSKYLYIIFKLPSDREIFYDHVTKQRKLNLENCQQENLVYKWQIGAISNYDYLIKLNSLADRSVNDLTQYPVFPWVIADYSSHTLDLSKEESFRDLSKPVGALNQDRLTRLRERSKEMPEPKFLYGSHYSTPGFVLFYLVRQYPLYMLCLQNGKFDHPDRMFNSVIDTWNNVTTNQSDFKELVPEFYGADGEFLKNRKAIYFGTRSNGEPVWDVQLPPWATDPLDFVAKLREALESSYVSKNLNHWIDLIFGYKQQGEEAVNADNVFYHLCYEGSVDLGAITDLNEKIAIENQIMEFGQIPKQLFESPHPEKSPSLCLYNNAEVKEQLRNKLQEDSSVDETLPKLLKLFHHLPTIEKLREEKLHRSAITHVSFTPNGETVVSLGRDGSLKAYSFPDLQRVSNLDSGSLAFSSCIHLPNTNEVLIGCWDNYLYRFNYKLCQKKDSLQAHSDAISCLDISEDVLVTGSWDCLVRVWDTSNMNNCVSDSGWSGWRVRMDSLVAQMDHDGPVNCVKVNPSEETFASATTDGYVNVWRLRKDVNVFSVLCHEGIVNDISWSLDGSRLVSCGDDGKLVLLNGLSSNHVSLREFGLSLKSLIWDGRMLLVGAESGSIFWYDVALGVVLRAFEKAHTGPVTALCLSPDCTFFISGGEDRRVVLWGIYNADDSELEP